MGRRLAFPGNKDILPGRGFDGDEGLAGRFACELRLEHVLGNVQALPRIEIRMNLGCVRLPSFAPPQTLGSPPILPPEAPRGA